MILSFCISMNAQDTELPVFNDCPSDIYVTIESQCDTVVSWVAPVDVTDNDAIAIGTLVQVSGPSSGSDLTPGNYTIVYTVEDLTGNIGTCSFVVHVYGIPEEGLACAPMNLSLNEDCMTVLNPRMFLQDTSNIDCLDNYVVMILDEDLNPITDTLTQEHVGNTYMYMVGLPNSGFSCMNTVTVEDKFAPKITCENDTVGCYALNTAIAPVVDESCVGFTLIPLPELRETIDCDDDFIGRVTRRFYARDDFGNTSDTCTQVIMLRRVDLSGFTSPENKTRANINPLSCDVPYALDDNGNPIPSVTGVPTINGLPVYPTPVFLCNANVTYEDNNLPTNGCIKTIIRRWTVTEWWCSQELTTSVFQTIEIVDDKAPVLSCPDDMSFSTAGHDCTATVNLPQISIVDACNTVDFVSVTYDGKTMLSNGGTVEIPVGVNLITYTARDKCGNTESCSFTVTVTDQRKPVAICLQNTVVSLTNYGTAYLYADMVDKGSFDDCKLETIEIRRMDDNCGIGSNTVFGDRVQFCCEDMGTDVMVVLRVTDSSGNFNECMVSVAVQNKILPKVTSCPDDVTITCTDYFNPEDLGATFGNITVS
ncbi:MAG: HYR domain-containing protein, partial [Candidatus Heimdallarchaeota archaeon]